MSAAADSSTIDIVDANSPKPCKKGKGFVLVCGLVGAAGGLSYLLAGSAASSKMMSMNFSSSQQQAAQVYVYELFSNTAGVCLDDSSNYYSFVRYGGGTVSSPGLCAEKCSLCPGQETTLVLRGYGWSAGVECTCYVDQPTVPFASTLCDGEGATYVYASNAGTGEVSNSEEVSGPSGLQQECWRVVPSMGSKSNKAAKSGKRGETKAPNTKSSKQPVLRKLGQKDESLDINNVEGNTNSQISE